VKPCTPVFGIFLTAFAVFQTIGGSFIVSAGQSAFENRLINRLPHYAPSVDAVQVIRAGATGISTFPSAVRPGIILSYLDGLHVVFALGIALAGLSFVAAAFAPGGKINISKAFGGSTETKDTAPPQSENAGVQGSQNV
jgi:MFS transporter, DHA2 family, glioxin efflux transporter